MTTIDTVTLRDWQRQRWGFTRASLAAERLSSLGYSRIVHYVDGKKSWIAAGLPLQS